MYNMFDILTSTDLLMYHQVESKYYTGYVEVQVPNHNYTDYSFWEDNF